MPTAVLEAMACGRPVVATAVGGVDEALRDRENGLVVRPNAPAELTNGVLALLGDPALAQRVATAARRTAVARYRWEVVAARTLAVYHEVLA
jgi:glycosyltransferase involved in cell wall biosynthesis